MPEEIFRTIIIALGSAAVLTLLVWVIARFRRPRKEAAGKFEGATDEWVAPEYAYNLKASLMTAGESRFYFILRDILPDHYVVIPQLPLTAVTERPAQGAALARIDRKSADFGVFRVQKREKDKVLRPVFLIELDDETHSLPSREERDRFVNGLCRQIGLPLLRIPAREYDAREVATLVKPFI